jgi:serine/threonine protein kinase
MRGVERLGRFELVHHLATGGMADVYLARRLGIGGFDRKLAIKTLRAGDEAFIGMFLDEARILAGLNHRHVVQAYEVDCTNDGIYYLVMEYVDGHPVRRLLQEAVQRDVLLPLDFSLSVITAVAAALQHAHDHDIIHRDVSPSNVLIGYDGSVKLIDFGIAKTEVRATRTNVGYIKGKAGYMAPEQVRGYEVDTRTDIFSLGILAYELTTRRRAFPAHSAEEQLRQLSEGSVAPPALVIEGYPRELERIVMTALEEDPDDRHLDARSMQLALERFAADLHIVIGPEVIARVMNHLMPRRLPSQPMSEEETNPYPIEISVEDLAAMSTPTPVWARA